MSRFFRGREADFQKLYKYMNLNEFVIKTVKERSFFLRHPSEFNDPNEFEVMIEDLDEHVYLQNKSDITADIISFLANVFIVEHEVGDYEREDISRCLGFISSQGSEVSVEFINKKVKPFVERYFYYFLDDWRVTCFSKDNKNQLMWSHYADGMKGVCLGFRLSGNGFDRLQEVEYPIDNKKPKIGLWEACRESDLSKVSPLKTKHKSWSYEKEWRLIEKNRYHDFHVKDLKEIYFGYKADREKVYEFLCMLENDFQLKGVSIFVVFPTPEIYGVECYPVSKSPDKAIHEIDYIRSISRNKFELDALIEKKDKPDFLG